MGLYIDFQERSAANLQRALDSVPRDAALAGQTLVVVNPPDYTYSVGVIPFALATAGDPTPASVRGLSAGSSDVELTRIDARTLRVRLPQGLFPHAFSRYYRSAELRFAPGDRLALDDMSVEIEAVTSSGDPEVILYRFPQPLEHATLRWLRWQDGVYRALVFAGCLPFLPGVA